jgi:hypothetical protein
MSTVLDNLEIKTHQSTHFDNLDQLSLPKHENTKMKNPTHDTNTIVITSL